MRSLRHTWAWLLAALAIASDGRAEPPPEVECMIEPRTRVALATAVEAVIESIAVDRGDRVARGDALVQLEADVERAAVGIARLRAEAKSLREQSRVRHSYAERAMARQQQLNRSNVISASQLDEAQSTLQLAQVGLAQADEEEELADQELERSRALLALRTLRSPIDGVVVERHKSPGELADEQPILELMEIDPLHVEVMVPVELFGRIEVGALGLVRPEAPIGGEHEARVVVVDPVVDGASGTFGVRLELPNPEHRIPAGLECHVQFEGAAADPGSGATASRDGLSPP